jgi:hypothetical protein
MKRPPVSYKCHSESAADVFPIRALAEEALSDERMEILIALVAAFVLTALYAVAMWIDMPAS